MTRRLAAMALFTVGVLVVAACGDDGDGGGGGDVSADTEVLNEQDRALVDERITELANAQVQEHQDVSGGGYGYSDADRVVTGYPSEYQTPLDRCQALADALGELDGPPGTVPVRIIESRNDDTGNYDVLARGAAGSACEET